MKPRPGTPQPPAPGVGVQAVQAQAVRGIRAPEALRQAVQVTATNERLNVSVGVSMTEVCVRLGVSVTPGNGSCEAVLEGLQLQDVHRD